MLLFKHGPQILLNTTTAVYIPLISIKNQGELIKPSDDVTEFSRIVENEFQTKQSFYTKLNATDIRNII